MESLNTARNSMIILMLLATGCAMLDEQKAPPQSPKSQAKTYASQLVVEISNLSKAEGTVKTYLEENGADPVTVRQYLRATLQVRNETISEISESIHLLDSGQTTTSKMADKIIADMNEKLPVYTKVYLHEEVPYSVAFAAVKPHLEKLRKTLLKLNEVTYFTED